MQNYIYTDGYSMDYDLIRIASKQEQITMNKNFLERRFKTFFQSPFNEIRWASLYEVCDENWKNLLFNQPAFNGKYEDYLFVLKRTIKKSIVSMWNSEEKHLVLHSCGHDSRTISQALAELRDEGMELGELHFRCREPECKDFFEIMQREGWDKSQYSCYDASEPDSYDYGSDRSTNGFCGYHHQVNWWKDIVSYEEEKDWIIVNGWGGEVFRYIGRMEKEITKVNAIYYETEGYHRYASWHAQWILRFKDMIEPLLGYEYLKEAIRVRKDWCISYTRTSDKICTDLSNSFKFDLQDIPRMDHNYNYNISPERKKDMMARYYRSKFFKEFKININPFATPTGWDAQLWGFATTVYEKVMT